MQFNVRLTQYKWTDQYWLNKPWNGGEVRMSCDCHPLWSPDPCCHWSDHPHPHPHPCWTLLGHRSPPFLCRDWSHLHLDLPCLQTMHLQHNQVMLTPCHVTQPHLWQVMLTPCHVTQPHLWQVMLTPCHVTQPHLWQVMLTQLHQLQVILTPHVSHYTSPPIMKPSIMSGLFLVFQ